MQINSGKIQIICSLPTTVQTTSIINIKWDYNYYQPWSDNKWLVNKMLAMLDEDITI